MKCIFSWKTKKTQNKTNKSQWKWVLQWKSSFILWIENISANSYKTACLSSPDNYLLSAPHLCLLFSFFLHYFLCCSLSLGSRWCWSLVNEYLGPLPHGEPDLLARFYGPFQSCPSLNTASCWPHGRNVVPCPSSKEKGGGGTVGLVPKRFYWGHKHMWPCGGKQHKEKKKMQWIWCFWIAVLTSCALCCKIKNL